MEPDINKQRQKKKLHRFRTRRFNLLEQDSRLKPEGSRPRRSKALLKKVGDLLGPP